MSNDSVKKSILIQSRLSSKRFPKKMMSPVGTVPMVEFIYRRCCASANSNSVAVITSNEKSDDELFAYCREHDIEVFRGSLENVLDRYIQAAELFESNIVCRVCGDSPLVDVDLIDEMLEMLEKENLDYVAPNKEMCIAGLDAEVVTVDALKSALSEAASNEELEHVTPYIKNNSHKFKSKIIDTDLKIPGIKHAVLTVDYPKDLLLINEIVILLGNRSNFSSRDVLEVLSKNKHLFEINKTRKR